MPTYRVHTDPPELLEADSCRVEGIIDAEDNEVTRSAGTPSIA